MFEVMLRMLMDYAAHNGADVQRYDGKTEMSKLDKCDVLIIQKDGKSYTVTVTELDLSNRVTH